MLLKCIGARDAMSVVELAILLKEYGRKAIMRPAEML
jgi:hypothetical protein